MRCTIPVLILDLAHHAIAGRFSAPCHRDDPAALMFQRWRKGADSVAIGMFAFEEGWLRYVNMVNPELAFSY
jgi:hypothetical protein